MNDHKVFFSQHLVRLNSEGAGPAEMALRSFPNRSLKFLPPNGASAPFCFSAVLSDPTEVTSPNPALKLSAYAESQMRNIAYWRENFRHGYPTSLSNIDTHIGFHSTADVFRYMPRALWIGLATPFPAMWIERGKQTGRVGRIISGVESCAMYIAVLLAGICLWKEPKNPAVLLLVIFVLLNLTLFGLVITNIGCLYRLRYVHWLLILVLAARAVRNVRPPALFVRSHVHSFH